MDGPGDGLRTDASVQASLFPIPNQVNGQIRQNRQIDLGAGQGPRPLKRQSGSDASAHPYPAGKRPFPGKAG